MNHKITQHIPINLKQHLYKLYKIFITLYSSIKTYYNYKKIPIIINNFNRLSFLKKLINSLEKRGYHNIYIIDNNSTYPPLLEYYKKCPYTIFRLKQNVGYKAIWDTNIYNIFKKSFYVYTDSDMEIDESCPDDFMKFFLNVHKKHPHCQKVGFGIRIDNLPNCFCNKKKVITYENQFWENEISPKVYKAMIDTTFALYKPFEGGPANPLKETYRTGFPYVIKHLPWYLDSSNYNDEEIYYLNTITQSTHWSVKNKIETKTIK